MGEFLAYKQQFSFLARYGEPFCVFDKNDSGNISFGVENKNGERFFVKIAGRTTEIAVITPAQCVAYLEQAVPLYEEMRHPNLIELVEYFTYEKYFAAVFRWREGECLYDHWNFDHYAKTGEPRPFERFCELPLEKRLRSFEVMLSFFEAVEAARYVSIDFYLGTWMYDFDMDTTTFCDIDFFLKQPCRNEMGRMWGQERFMAPEEWVLGAVLDDRTNVYRLGAAAFTFLCGRLDWYSKELDRSAEKWQANPALYQVALKATMPDPTERYACAANFIADWHAAL